MIDSDLYKKFKSEHIDEHKECEITLMYNEFWDKNASFHKLRREFVWKVCACRTPERFESNSLLK